VMGDNLQCQYHGLQYGPSGQCEVAPFDAKIPKNARVRSYPVRAMYEMLWIWMGDAGLADESLIPDFSCMTDPRRAHLHGYNHVKANYELVVDNLADLSHAHFLHGNFYPATPDLNEADFKVTEEGDSIWCKFWYADMKIPSLWNSYAGNIHDRVDRWSEIRWDAPSNVLLSSGFTPVGRPRGEGLDLYGVHLLTPESATTTHYFYCHCRGFRIDDPEIDAKVRHWQQVAFHEQDKPMLQMQQAVLGDETDLMAMSPVLLRSDVGAVRIRRRVKARIEAESVAEASNASGARMTTPTA